MTHDTPPRTLPPFEYSEQTDNIANPAADIYLTIEEFSAINHIQVALAKRRNDLANEQPDEIFMGITTAATPNEAQGSNKIVAIDVNHTTTMYPQYVVRVASLSRHDGHFTEEYILDDAEHRTYDRSPRQKIVTEAFGEMEVGQHTPDPRFSTQTQDLVPYAAISDARGVMHRIVSYGNVISRPTQAQIVSAAQQALNLDAHRDHYRYITDRFPDEGPRTTRYLQVQEALIQIHNALGSNELMPQDRERLVNLGHQIMCIANDNPEYVERGAVLNPEEAYYMAHAEITARERPDGLFGWRRKTKLRDAQQDAHLASFGYARFLRQSRVALLFGDERDQ